MAERNGSFYNSSELALGQFEKEWYSKHVSSDKKEYDMGSEALDNGMEHTIGNRLALVGPMLDSYL